MWCHIANEWSLLFVVVVAGRLAEEVFHLLWLYVKVPMFVSVKPSWKFGHQRSWSRPCRSMTMGEGVEEAKPEEDRKIHAAVENLLTTGVVPKARIDNFDTFCNLVLAYESRLEESKRAAKSRRLVREGSSDVETASSSPSSVASFDADTVDEDIEYPPGHESFENVTCFCGKPFAGRPMIECSSCLVWLHMSCAKVRPSNVPDVWTCQTCKEMNPRKRARLSRESSIPSPS